MRTHGRGYILAPYAFVIHWQWHTRNGTMCKKYITPFLLGEGDGVGVGGTVILFRSTISLQFAHINTGRMFRHQI